jgi:hypothetical protein
MLLLLLFLLLLLLLQLQPLLLLLLPLQPLMLPASACMEVNVDIARYVVNPFLLYFNLGPALFHVYQGFRIFLHQGITLHVSRTFAPESRTRYV